MTTSRLLMTLVVAGILAIATHTAIATTVYQWTDKAGVMHLTDKQPSPGVKRVRTLRVAKFKHHARHTGDYYSIINQARRVQASYLALEHALTQRRLLNAQQELFEARARYYIARSRLLTGCHETYDCGSGYVRDYGYYDGALLLH